MIVVIILRMMPLTNHKTSNFDIDFDFGSFSEQEIINIFEHNGRCEVKTERDIWQTTGNIAIEYRWKGNPSGISTTDADWGLISYEGVSRIPVKHGRFRGGLNMSWRGSGVEVSPIYITPPSGYPHLTPKVTRI